MRKISFIVLHCSGASQTQTVKSIQDYWKTVMKWKDPGYHYIIKPDGEAVALQPISKPSNGVKGFNANSIHICYIGGVDPKGRAMDNRTARQRITMFDLVRQMKELFPHAVIQGHRDFPDVDKNCPNFSTAVWLHMTGLDYEL